MQHLDLNAGGDVKIVFVDADLDGLNGTLRALAKSRPGWQLVPCSDATHALATIHHGGVDVVVTDTAIPGSTGVELLTEARRVSPSTARVVLAAEGDRGTAFHSTRVAHQFLAKPCNVERLKHAIDHVLACRAAVPTTTLTEIVGQVDDLPTPGPVHDRLMSAMQGDYSLVSLEEIVTSDVALTAELLRLVNSSFFGLVRQLERVADAISFLGIDVLNAVAAARSIFRPDPDSPVDVERVNRHSAAVAALAAIAHGTTSGGAHLRTQAFAAGLLHDLGVLVLARLEPISDASSDLAMTLAADDLMLERMAFGADRYSVARYLLSLWGFDETIGTAIGALAEPASSADRTGLGWTLRIAHEAILSGRISEADATTADEIDLKIELAGLVDELDVRGTLTRPLHAAV